jgi:hypothetical protein
MRPEDGESVRQDALETVDQQITRRPRYHLSPTRLQEVLGEFGAALEHATERLDEREQDVFLDIVTIRLAREQARRLDRQWKRAA